MRYLIGLIILIASPVLAEPGFHFFTENCQTTQHNYRVVTGVNKVDVLDEEGKPTGRKVDRPITEERSEQIRTCINNPGGTSVTYTNFGSGVTANFIGADVPDLIPTYPEIARDYLAVTIQDGEDVLRISWREWASSGRPPILRCGPKYHFGGPSITMRNSQCEGL